MRVYGLTKVGKQQARRDGGGSEVKVLHFLLGNPGYTATEDEIYVVGGERYILRRLKDRGLIVELTT